MTGKLVIEYKNPTHVPAASQGSMQNLPNGNVLVGYGFSGVFRVHARRQSLVRDALWSTRVDSAPVMPRHTGLFQHSNLVALLQVGDQC